MPVLICLLLIMHFFLFKSQVHIAIQIPKAHGATILPPFWNEVLWRSPTLPSIGDLFASTTGIHVKLNSEDVRVNGACVSGRTSRLDTLWTISGEFVLDWLLARSYSAEVGRGCWWPQRSIVQEISKDWRCRSSSKKLSARHHVNSGSRRLSPPTSLRDRHLFVGHVRGMKRRNDFWHALHEWACVALESNCGWVGGSYLTWGLGCIWSLCATDNFHDRLIFLLQ